MSYDCKFKTKVKVAFEAGVGTKELICKNYNIPRKTLLEWAKKGNWLWKKSNAKVIGEVTKSAEVQIKRKLSRQLENVMQDHLTNLDSVEMLTKKSISRLQLANEESDNNLAKIESDAIFAMQKCLKIASETYEIIHKNKRLALGIDKPDTPDLTTPSVKIEINNTLIQQVKQNFENEF